MYLWYTKLDFHFSKGCLFYYSLLSVWMLGLADDDTHDLSRGFDRLGPMNWRSRVSLGPAIWNNKHAKFCQEALTHRFAMYYEECKTDNLDFKQFC